MTAKNNASIKNTIMSRVYTIHSMQMVLNTTVVSIAVFVIALYGIGREVWVSRVLHNMPSPTNIANFGAVLRFYLSAFMDTRLIVQILSIVAVGAIIWLAYSIVRMAAKGTTRTPMRFA